MGEQVPDGGLTLDSGRLRLAFDTADGAVALADLSGADGRSRLARRVSSLWKMELRGPNGAVEIDGDGATPRGAVRTEHGAGLAWSVTLGDSEATVSVEIRLPEGSPLSHWSLAADLPPGYTVTRADFPHLPGLSSGEGLKLAVPQGWGMAFDVRPGLSVEAPYPSCQAAMGFVALYGDGCSLYLGAHDPEAHFKTFLASADDAAVSLSCAHWPATEGGAWRLAYEVTLGIVPGGWYEAAQVYRGFALTAPWTGKTLAERDVPRWLLDTELWLKPGETPWTDDDEECRRVTFQNVDACIRAKDFFDVPIAVHWYRWHQIPYDTLYPEYFPPKAGFLDGVKAAQAAGLPVMPYINGRLCDPESETWKSGGAEWAARDDDGHPYTELYGSQVPLNPMCPNARPWQDTVAGLVRRLIEEVGTDGVYIDQIGAAQPLRCARTDHGHRPGGGAAWVAGYRAMLEKARRFVPDGRILTTEENAEPFMDLFDGYLVVNTHTSLGEVIPLYPAVYAGRCVCFGFQYIPATEPARSLGFRSKMARAFLWGAQPGWIDAAKLMDPAAIAEAEFVRAMCHVRRRAYDFLLHGRFLGPVEARGDNPRMTDPEAIGSFGGTYALDLPAVMAAAWLSPDGRLGIAVTNMDDAPHTVTLGLPLDAAGLKDSAGLTLETIGPDGPKAAPPPTEAETTLDIPARSARLLVFAHIR